MQIRIATRGSELALAQARSVARLLEARGCACELVMVRTQGDLVLDRPLTGFAGKGIFTKEVDLAVSEGTADISVHSLKDMPAGEEDGLVLAAVPRRASDRDVLVLNPLRLGNDQAQEIVLCGEPSRLGDLLEADMPIGCGSPRRQAQLAAVLPAACVCGVRGNIFTRLRKMREHGWAGLIMAEAAVERLGLGLDLQSVPLPFLPAPGQGALGIRARSGDNSLLALLAMLSDEEGYCRALAEREFILRFAGGCHIPVGLRSCADEGVLSLEAAEFSAQGAVLRRASRRVPLARARAAAAGAEIAGELCGI